MTSPDPAKSDEAERRRRAAELLGDIMPGTRDDTDEGWGESSAPSRDDELLDDVPPHHG